REPERARRNIFGHYATGADIRADADLNRPNKRRIRANECALADIGWVFGYAVIIASDSAGADISTLTHARVANVGEVFRLGASLDLGLFHFNKIANLHILPKIGAYPQSRERANARTFANTRTLKVRE